MIPPSSAGLSRKISRYIAPARAGAIFGTIAAMKLKTQIEALPRSPGVYLFRDRGGRVIYVGKAISLRDRVKQYFQKHDGRPQIPLLVPGIRRVDHLLAGSELEALILEAELIKRYQPKFNRRERDDKSYAMLEVRFWRRAREEVKERSEQVFPRISIVRYRQYRELLRKRQTAGSRYFGPFQSGESLRQALKILRKIFPHRDCSTAKFRRYQLLGRGCLYHSLKLCDAPCAGKISEADYRRNIENLIKFIKGKKGQVATELNELMAQLARQERFEEAAQVRDRLYLLEHIQEYQISRREGLRRPVDKIEAPNRIEAYDVSNIFGDYAVGSMVVFERGIPNKDWYRRFRIKTVKGANDVAMLSEVIRRRLRHSEWPLPEVIIVDGGRAQLNATSQATSQAGLKIPILSVAKGISRKRADRHWHGGEVPISEYLLRKIRDEAHRFAISYYRLRHRKGLLNGQISQVK